MDRTTRAVLIVLAVILTASLGSCLVIGGMMGPWMPHDMWGGHGWHWPLGMGLGMVLFWGAVIGALYLFARHWPHDQASPSPLDILKRRYAQGEITREQYEQMRKDLGA